MKIDLKDISVGDFLISENRNEYIIAQIIDTKIINRQTYNVITALILEAHTSRSYNVGMQCLFDINFCKFFTNKSDIDKYMVFK